MGLRPQSWGGVSCVQPLSAAARWLSGASGWKHLSSGKVKVQWTVSTAGTVGETTVASLLITSSKDARYLSRSVSKHFLRLDFARHCPRCLGHINKQVCLVPILKVYMVSWGRWARQPVSTTWGREMVPGKGP